MSTELIITIQVVFALIVAIVILLLITRRQKQTITQLKDILTSVKEEISGENLTGYLQMELDDTTAHCAQETVALRPELSAEDMAISLRFMVLQAELALVQDRVGSARTPWSEKIRNYIGLAEKVLELSKARVDHATKTLNDTHNEELAAKDESITALETEKRILQEQLDNLKPLVTCLQSAAETEQPRNDLELKLHKALLGICENFPNSEQLRELVYLLHEAYYESGSESAPGSASESATESPSAAAGSEPPTNFAQSQNIGILNNIIDQQSATIKTLKQQIETLENQQERDALEQTVDSLDDVIRQGSECLDSIKQDIPFETDTTLDNPKAGEVIDQFIEDSAAMVEKIHMLSNQNKQLMLENDEMRKALESTSENEDPMVAGLTLKLENQQQELITLQTQFQDLEERYLTLYEEKHGNRAPPML
ncbi:hypothetical protein [Ketobacter sp.]|uniref:hypothetical protein n=1 Tax=Ketobacter sp. TaxID=2083498 RepID=UPI000F193A38|nr:hypothetical protein [Ketobacter sp.]RLT93501.1 MAG: hypothetical protein D9N14_18555 [Ketobacter sp.]